MSTETQDRLLDALDDAPIGVMDGVETYVGPLATIQHLATVMKVSDSCVRRTAFGLLEKGLVRMWNGYDPGTRRRRIYIAGQAANVF